MDDTQKEFESWLNQPSHEMTGASLGCGLMTNDDFIGKDITYVKKAWQACQNLNNERIAKLEAKINAQNIQIEDLNSFLAETMERLD